MRRHNLTEIDLVARTALCSVCGPTEIHVYHPRTENPPKIICDQQTTENRLNLRAWRQRRQPARRPRHILGDIDEQKRTGVCAICGPTAVYRYKSKGRLLYRCATYVQAHEINHRTGGVHLVNSSASVHVLSHIDKEKNIASCARCGLVRIEWNAGPCSAASLRASETINKQAQENIRLFYEYKRRHTCKRCRCMAIVDPNGFNFFEMHLPQEQSIAVLVETAEPEELIAELEKRDLYCNKCLRLINRSFANNTPVPEFRPISILF